VIPSNLNVSLPEKGGQRTHESRHHGEDHEPPLRSGLGRLPQRDSPSLGDRSEVVDDHLLYVHREDVVRVVLPNVVSSVVPGIDRLDGLLELVVDLRKEKEGEFVVSQGEEGKGQTSLCLPTYLELVQNRVEPLARDEVVVRLEESRTVPSLAQVQRDGTAGMVEGGEVVPDPSDARVESARLIIFVHVGLVEDGSEEPELSNIGHQEESEGDVGKSEAVVPTVGEVRVKAIPREHEYPDSVAGENGEALSHSEGFHRGLTARKRDKGRERRSESQKCVRLSDRTGSHNNEEVDERVSSMKMMKEGGRSLQ